MKLDDPRQLDAMIKNGSLPSLVLLWGEDASGLSKALDKLEKSAVTAFPDFNLRRFDGRFPLDMDALADAVRSLPMMAPRRMAVIDDLDPGKLKGGDLEKLRQLMEEVPEETLFVITIFTVQPDFKRKGDKAAAFVDLCAQKGAACGFQKPSPAAAAQGIAMVARRAGSSIGQEEARMLAEYCGRDPLRMGAETRKLAAHSPGGITREDIEALVTPVTEARVYDLAGRILARDYTAALGTIHDLIFLRESPVSILTVLTMSFVDMYRAAAARKAGIPDGEARKALGGMNAYRYDQAVKNQQRFTLPALEAILELLADADRRCKSTGIDPQTVLETTVAEIFRRMDGAA